MKIKFDVTPKEFIIVKDILEKYLQDDGKAWVFGSRAKSSSLVGSDLDLAIECQDKMALKLLAQIKIAFEDSRLPYRVDVVDMKAVKPYFKELIKDEMIVFPLKNLNKVPELRFPEFSKEWRINKLKNITSYVDYRGKMPPKSDCGIFLVTAKNIKVGFIDYEASKEYIPKEIYEGVMRRGKPQIGDVLITTEAPLGNVAAIDREDIALAQRVIKLRGNKDVINNDFLKHHFLSPVFQSAIYKKSSGGTVKGIKGSELHKMPVAFPPIPEQQKIAAFLTQVDNKIEQLTQKKQFLEDYKKGVMQQIFSQEIRFKQDDGSDYPDWEAKRLGNILDIFNGYAFSSNETVVNGIKWVKISNVGIQEMNNTNMSYLPKNFIASHKKYILKKGDYVVALTRPILNGKLKIAKIDDFFNNSLLNQRVGKLKSPENNLDFLYFLFQKNSLIQYIASTIAGSEPPNLSPNTIKTIKVFIPSLGEQTKIANFLTEIDTKINQVEKQLSGTQQFKSGLLQQMFV